MAKLIITTQYYFIGILTYSSYISWFLFNLQIRLGPPNITKDTVGSMTGPMLFQPRVSKH